MRVQKPSVDLVVAPAQVWAGLTTETQAAAIQLLARLASDLVAQGFDSTHKESLAMSSRLSHPKIRPEHLDRQALIYVRQSSPIQVREHTASTARQYDLARYADQLGWPKEHIQVIDQDQGLSGASALTRDGFQHLMAEVSLGRAGAVLSLEASRLARCCSDWYRLIEICGLTDTLVVDEDGVYDPTQYNDRLVLGIKGTMSAAELHWIRSRLLGAKLKKAETGQLRYRPPTGLVYDPAGQLVLDPDEQVQQAVHLVFSTFEELGAALGVVQYFARNHLSFPTRLYGGSRDGQLLWRPLDHGRVLAILHNPAYAGTYVYGRTKTRQVVLPGEEPRVKGTDAPRRRGGLAVRAARPSSRLHHLGAIPAARAPTDRELHITASGASWGDPRGCGAAPGSCAVRPVRAAHDHPLHE